MQFKIGDKVMVVSDEDIPGLGWNCQMDDLYESHAILTISHIRTENRYEVKENMWIWDTVHLKLVSTAKNSMTLTPLTDEQKAILSAEDQALIEAGYIGCDLTRTSKGTVELKNMLFAKYRAALAAKATKEVAEAKKEAEKVSK